MKIKLDFVTNSSSCCYVISSPKPMKTSDFVSISGGSFNEFQSLSTIEELIKYTDSEPCDWVKKATGPRRFWGCQPREYEKYKAIIESGNSVIIAHVERNFEDVEVFDIALSKMNCEVLEREYD
jgi:hypothetical protein